MPRGLSLVALRWRILGRPAAVRLKVRPFLSGRDLHALHHANPAFNFDALAHGERVSWTPYEGVPGIEAVSNGTYRPEPEWYRNFMYAEERARGLDFEEDLGAPGIFSWDLAAGEAVLILGTAGALPPGGAVPTFDRLRRTEHDRRTRLGSGLARAADAYLVRRGTGRTIVAGYPWFTDWGRDTFIALRGLCLATGRLSEARSILLQWAGHVSQGMLPNRFVDQGDAPEFNSVDASLWYVVAVHDYLRAVEASGGSHFSRRPENSCGSSHRDRLGLQPRDPLRHSTRARRAPRRGRARGAAHLDGCQGGGLGGDTADRQAGGDPGTLAQRAANRRRVHTPSIGRLWSRGFDRSTRGSGIPAAGTCTT